MSFNPSWGKSGKPGKLSQKKTLETPSKDLLKRGPFKPTLAFVKFVETNVFNRKTPLSKPKSQYCHGLRVLFAECDPYLVLEIVQAAQSTFVKHTTAYSCINK